MKLEEILSYLLSISLVVKDIGQQTKMYLVNT